MIHSCSPNCREGPSLNCRKGFPKPYCMETEWDEHGYYPKYRRRPPGFDFGEMPLDRSFQVTVGGKVIDNGYVVPFSPYILLKFETHINVELCTSSMAAKYLFKYRVSQKSWHTPLIFNGLTIYRLSI